MADAMIHYHPSAFFFGGGVGISTAIKEGRDSVFELVGDLGVDVFKKPNLLRLAHLSSSGGPPGKTSGIITRFCSDSGFTSKAR